MTCTWDTSSTHNTLLNGGHFRVTLRVGIHQVGRGETDLAARELVVLLQGVRNPPPLLVPGLRSPLCPLLSLLLSLRWFGRGEA